MPLLRPSSLAALKPSPMLASAIHRSTIIRALHGSPTLGQPVPLIVAGLGIGAIALGAKYVIQGVEHIKENKEEYQAEYDKASKQFESVKPQWMKDFGKQGFYEGGFEGNMSRREAALILGVREGADEKTVQASHRRLMVKNHPDMGGSPFVATKINEAKELLLSGKSHTNDRGGF